MKLYFVMNRIAYVTSSMSFSEGLTFFTNDNGYLDMLSRVRDEQISFYCESIVENASDNLNLLEENIGLSAHIKGDNSAVGDSNGDYFLESEGIIQQKPGIAQLNTMYDRCIFITHY